ncbi:histamine H3 receptor-like [Heptranchias perlo]|uniref:histamine H3 receptor-like n=1 Tax=Heptranchias perlo TaxID=212740 RepID=UPI00355A8B4F
MSKPAALEDFWRALLVNASLGAEGNSSHGSIRNFSQGAALAETGRFFYGQFSETSAVLLASLMILLVIVTVLGNALVVLAFVVDKSLRSQNNFFLLNLAISDFLVGAFCIPMYVPYVLTGRWMLGKNLCKLWLVIDYLLCTSSVFNIVLISYDRFLSVTRPVTYRAKQGKRRNAAVKMMLIWLTAFLLYGPAITAWEHIIGRSIVPEGECYAEFYYNWYFLITASMVEFFVPFISVTFFNLSIYLNIQKRTRTRLDISQDTMHNKPSFGNNEVCSDSAFFLKVCKIDQKTKLINPKLLNSTNTSPEINIEGERSETPTESEHRNDLGKMIPPFHFSEVKCLTKESITQSQPFSERKIKLISQNVVRRFRLSRDKKVAKSLAIIVCIFGFCWAPYTLLMIIRAVCHGHCISHYWYEASFWFLWINSAINPVLYPLCHKSFKKAFMKLLCSTKLKIQPHSLLRRL